MKKKAWKPRREKSKYPTLTGKPPLGYLNTYYCPICGKHLFSYYDADAIPNRQDGYKFAISNDLNYCSKCGVLLDLDEWKRKDNADKELVLED